MKKPLHERKAVSPHETFSQSVISHWKKANQTRNFPKTAQLPCLVFHPSRRAPCHHSGFNANEGVYLAHTLSAMLVFLGHICKAKTRQQRALTTALQSIPNEYREKGSGEGKMHRESAKTLTSSKCHRCLTLPTGSPNMRS